jgi:exonuclease SbcD
MIRIAHCADLQLDSRALSAGVLDLDPETGLNRRLLDTARCWEAFCAGAIDARVDLVIVAGDIFERPKPTPTEYRLFLDGLDRLLWSDQVGPVILIAGNHDIPMSMADDDALAPLAGRHEKLLVSSTPNLFPIETADGLLQVVTLPYPRKAAISLKQEHADLTPQEIGQRMIKGMERILDGFRAQFDPTLPSVLVAHPTVTGAAISEAQPSVPVEVPSIGAEMFNGFTYTAMGHIHKRQTFSNASPMEGEFPYFAHYPGSMDRRDFGEEHEDKSWDLVTLEEGAGFPPSHLFRVTKIDPQPLPARIFRTLSPSDVRLLDLDEATLARLLADQPILRVKGQVTSQEADELLKITGSWRVLVANALEVERETRARDATMTGDLSPDRALRAHLEKSGDGQEEIDALMTLHHSLAPSEQA